MGSKHLNVQKGYQKTNNDMGMILRTVFFSPSIKAGNTYNIASNSEWVYGGKLGLPFILPNPPWVVVKNVCQFSDLKEEISKQKSFHACQYLLWSHSCIHEYTKVKSWKDTWLEETVYFII